MLLFSIMENQANKVPATAGWSIPIESLENAPDDYRIIDIMQRPDQEGILITYLVDEGIELYELNWFGEIERSLFIEENVSSLRVLDVGFNDNTYFVYASDRNTLERYSIDIESLTLGEKSLVSESSEQFSVMEEAVIVGDDEITQIILEDEIVATFEEYEDLKRVNISFEDNKIIATMDTQIGSSIITVYEDEVKARELIPPEGEQGLGYLQDVFLKDGVITVLSSKHHVGEDFPTSLGMWQLDGDLNETNHEFWYHNRTSLRPIITDVNGDNVDYILGVLTRQDENRERVMEQPRLQDGTFTNVLSFTTNKGDLIDYERLTATREYPIGYEFIESEDGDIIIWTDKVGDNSHIKFSGKGEQWISYANKNYSVDYIQISSEILVSFITSIVWGIILSAMDLMDYILVILIFFILAVVFNRVVPFEEERKSKYLFVMVAIFVTSFKFYVTAIGNDAITAYGHIYPYILGSDVVLGLVSILTSFSSLFLINLWYNRNKDLSDYLHIFMFIGFEVYFYLFSIMVYVVSAMSKVTLMI